MPMPMWALLLTCACILVSSARVDATSAAGARDRGPLDSEQTAQSTVPAPAPLAAAAREAIWLGRGLSAGQSIVLGGIEQVAAIPEQRSVVLVFPPVVRLGDFDTIKLTFEASGETAKASPPQMASNSGVGGDVGFQSAYDGYIVVAQAELDLAGLQTLPYGPVSEPLAPGKPAIFVWSLRASSTGIYRGTAWLFLRFVDKKSGEEIRLPISAQPLQIRVTSLGGMPGATARLVGGLGLAASIALAFPLALEAWERIRRARRPRA